MAEKGMEELMGGEKVTGADVAHPAWLGFIPLRKKQNDPAVRSPIHFNTRSMRPEREPAPHHVHDFVHKLVHGLERFRNVNEKAAAAHSNQMKEEMKVAMEALQHAEATGDAKAIEMEKQSVDRARSAAHEAHETHKRARHPVAPVRPEVDENSLQRFENFGAGAQVYKRRCV